MDPNPFDLLDAEAQRIDRFYAKLSGDAWHAPTRCPGWTRKDLLAHLVSGEDYTRACLDDTVTEYLAQAGSAGPGDRPDYEGLNDVLVRQRADAAGRDLLAEWGSKLADNHRRLRQRGADAKLATSVGMYSLGRQACYLACELAIHADDAGVPVTEEERAGRLAWRAWFGIDALAENAPTVRIEPVGDRYDVRLDEIHTVITADELVEVTSGRLPADHPIPAELRRALVVLV